MKEDSRCEIFLKKIKIACQQKGANSLEKNCQLPSQETSTLLGRDVAILLQKEGCTSKNSSPTNSDAGTRLELIGSNTHGASQKNAHSRTNREDIG